MSQFDDTKELAAGQLADVRLFPLPNLVMFPHVMQPLSITEPRYCQLLTDALADDNLIALALLEPGWEPEYDEQPALASTVCVTRVVAHVEESSGRHNILVNGLCRADVRRELETRDPYRAAEVRLQGDCLPTETALERQQLRRTLVETFRSYLPASESVQEQFEPMFSSQVPFGVLTDIIAFTIRMDVQLKQRLLGQLNVDRRAELLLEQLLKLPQQYTGAAHGFPPEFSAN